ncbi:MAG TPA: SusC/RagA family TonB-linked outer membrane protein [Bacteroidales bacterium]|nr:SusC/RagA family TonB-linked outer membrane protein [Bacteroidales bacterium]
MNLTYRKILKNWRKAAFLALLMLPGLNNMWGQETRLNLPSTTMTLAELFKSVQDKSEIRFFYNDDLINPDQRVTLSSTKLTVAEMLDELKRQTSLSFRLMGSNMIAVTAGTQARDIQLSGRVTDSSTGEPIAGVTVTLRGTNIGVLTDINGKYSVSVPGNVEIVAFSFIGYNTVEIPVAGRSVIDVSMEEGIQALDEVVVTALNVNRTKSSLGYSISTVKGADIEKSGNNNMINTLAGKVAGLHISRTAGGVDGSSRVILRGVMSITKDSRPLVIVDGIPVDAGHSSGGRWGGSSGGDALGDINPDDIENISILKGAGAAAAYGSRGANGVILITTKKGAESKGLGITVNSSIVAETPLLLPRLQNKYGHGSFGTYPASVPDDGFPWGWSWGPEMKGQMVRGYAGDMVPFSPQPGNFRDFFRTGSMQANTVTIETGTPESSVRASFSTQNNKGIVPRNNLTRQTINLRGFSRSRDILELDGKIAYMHSKITGRPEVAEGPGNPAYYLSQAPRNISNDYLRNNYEDDSGKELLWTKDVYTGNPYWQLYNKDNEEEKHRVQGVFSGKIIVMPGLDITARSGLDMTYRLNHSDLAKGSICSGNVNGSVYNSISNFLEWNSDVLANYSNRLGEDLKYTVNFGGNYRYNYSRGIGQYGSNLKINKFYAISNCWSYSTNEWLSKKEVFSVYSLGQVSFRDWLYFDVTLRNDWSSTLPPGSNSYFYHSENLSFLFTKALNTDTRILSSGKLRASFAKVGNDTNPYETNQYFYVSQSQLPYPFGTFSDVLPTYDLQPELTHSWEAGVNLEFLNSRIILDVTAYTTNSNNQIIRVQLPVSSGFNRKVMNAADLRNRGIELQADFSVIRSRKFNWDMTLTWSKNKTMVKELYKNASSFLLDETWFATIQAVPGEEYGLIYTRDFKRDAFGRVLVDDNGFVLAGEYKRMGKITPDWTGSISGKVSYGNFSLAALVDIRMGGNVYSIGKAYRCLFGTSAETLTGREEWYSTHDPEYLYSVPLPGIDPNGYIEKGFNENTGQPNAAPVDPMYRWYNIWSKEIGTEWLLDATNARLREISLTYSVPAGILKNFPAKGLSVSVIANNLLCIYNAMKDIDPESGYSSGNVGGGFEHSALPSTRTYGFNVKIDF